MRTTDGFSLLHCAVIANCFDVVQFLVEECSGIDVNVTDDDLLTPLHMAYVYGHTQIAEYLVQHGADVCAVNSYGQTPYQYIDGHPNCIKASQYLQNKRKIHHIPFSHEHCYYMKLRNLGNDNKEAVSLTIEQFPSLREDGPTQPHHDIDHASGLKEFTQFIIHTKRSTDDPNNKQPPSEEQRSHIKELTGYPWRRPLSQTQRRYLILIIVTSAYYKYSCKRYYNFQMAQITE